MCICKYFLGMLDLFPGIDNMFYPDIGWIRECSLSLSLTFKNEFVCR